MSRVIETAAKTLKNAKLAPGEIAAVERVAALETGGNWSEALRLMIQRYDSDLAVRYSNEALDRFKAAARR